MKRRYLMFAIFLIITSVNAQVNEKSVRKFYKQGDWELGFSSNIGSITIQTIQPSNYEYSESGIYLNIGLSTGFYIINGLSIEPEFDINLCSEGFSVSILSNLCYTLNLPQKKFFPYVKLGYGLSNDPKNSDDLVENIDFKTINAGAGVKLMYSSTMAFRVEINYRNLNGSKTFNPDTPYSYTSESTTSIFSVSLGISLLL